jgi:NTP pyrophosphatase (non-canonical NTP hydrolase)
MGDQSCTLQELLDRIVKFRDERDWKQFHKPKDLALALAIEVAEVLEHLRFKSDGEIEAYLQDAQHRREVGSELADVLYFTLLLSHEAGIDLADALEEKMKVIAQRYPVHLAKGSNRKYTELG